MQDAMREEKDRWHQECAEDVRVLERAGRPAEAREEIEGPGCETEIAGEAGDGRDQGCQHPAPEHDAAVRHRIVGDVGREHEERGVEIERDRGVPGRIPRVERHARRDQRAGPAHEPEKELQHQSRRGPLQARHRQQHDEPHHQEIDGRRLAEHHA
jgi:hypothetical protein